MVGKGKATLSKVSVKLPFGIGGAEWVPDHSERRAAWSLYVELATRITLQPLPDQEGVLREALNSLYTLFATTRAVLREAGPDVGVRYPSVGGIAIRVLNSGLRPFLTRWHPALEEWEAGRANGVGRREHEGRWPQAAALRQALDDLRKHLTVYGDALLAISSSG